MSQQFIAGVIPEAFDTGQKWPESLKFITGVNNTSIKLFTGVNDTAHKFFVSVVDTEKKTVLPKPACLDLKMKNKQNSSVKCTQLSSLQNMKKWRTKNISLLLPVLLTPLINSHSRISSRILKKFETVLFGTVPDRNRVTWETPSSEAIPFCRKPLTRTGLLRNPAQTQVWSEQVWLNTTFISQGSRSWDKLAVET